MTGQAEKTAYRAFTTSSGVSQRLCGDAMRGKRRDRDGEKVLAVGVLGVVKV